MSGAHVRCSQRVHAKLKEISSRQGVSLSHALELLVDGREAAQEPAGSWAALFPPDSAQTDPDAEFNAWLDQPIQQGDARGQDSPTAGMPPHLEERLQEILVGINQLTAAAGGPGGGGVHPGEHDHGWHCHQCHQMAEETYDAGRMTGIAEAERVPGVREAMDFHRHADSHNKQHSGNPMVASWAEVPGVKAALEKHRNDRTVINVIDQKARPAPGALVNITTGGPPAPTLPQAHYVPGEHVLENGSTRRVKVRENTEATKQKLQDFTELVRVSQGEMAGQQIWCRPQDLIPD